MAKIELKYLGDLRCDVKSDTSNVSFITDAGNDENGISPTDLLASALASCTASMMGFVAKNHNFSIDGMTITAKKEMDEATHTIKKFILDVKFANDLSQKELAILKETAKHCPVKRALNSDIEIELNIN